MRNLLALVGAAVIAFAGLGWYFGWYKLTFTKTSDGNLRVETDVNTKKVVTDSGDALKQVGDLVGEKVDKTAQDAKSGQPANTPGPVTPPQNKTDGGWLPFFQTGSGK